MQPSFPRSHRPIPTKPFTLQTNGKAELLIKTLLAEWVHVNGLAELSGMEPLATSPACDL